MAVQPAISNARDQVGGAWAAGAQCHAHDLVVGRPGDPRCSEGRALLMVHGYQLGLAEQVNTVHQMGDHSTDKLKTIEDVVVRQNFCYCI
ncbi:hypothetical protein D3C71_1897280 [compost metagenome]